MQTVFEVDDLPEGTLEASAAFHSQHLGRVRAVLESGPGEALAIVLPPAGSDHDDWRLALARDLARLHAPGRVNFVAGPAGEPRERILVFLADAPGVTGQYCKTHE